MTMGAHIVGQKCGTSVRRAAARGYRDQTRAGRRLDPRLVRAGLQRGSGLRLGVAGHRQLPPPPAHPPQPHRPCRPGVLHLPRTRRPPRHPATLPVLAAIAGRRWPVEEDFQVGKSHFGLADSQVRTYTALHRHIALAMAAAAICATAAAAATKTRGRAVAFNPRSCSPWRRTRPPTKAGRSHPRTHHHDHLTLTRFFSRSVAVNRRQPLGAGAAPAGTGRRRGGPTAVAGPGHPEPRPPHPQPRPVPERPAQLVQVDSKLVGEVPGVPGWRTPVRPSRVLPTSS